MRHIDFENARDRAAYAYLRNIKKWMFCPACKDGKMQINKRARSWICEDCGYRFSEEEFLDDMVFWFCDGCGSYLNNQEGFSKDSPKHICTSCGYVNDTSGDNVKGICVDCGKTLEDASKSLCVDCRKIRRDKWVERLEVAGAVAGAVTASMAASLGEKTADAGPGHPDDEDDYPTCNLCGTKMTEFDGCWWYTCPECGNMLKDTGDGNPQWEVEVFGPGSSSMSCANCGQSLSGGEYTAPWENGDNPDGYIKCPHCRYVNFIWED